MIGLKKIELLFVTIAALAASFVKESLDTYGPYISLTGAAASSVLVIVLLSVLWLLIRMTGLDPRFKFCGTWCDVIDHNDGKLVTTNQIKYDWLSDRFHLEGFAYVEGDDIPHSQWGSSELTFPERHTIMAIHSSKIFGKEPPMITGITRMRFNSGGGEQYFEGIGDLLDNTDPPYKTDFYFRKISRDKMKELIGATKIDSHEKRVAFVAKIREATKIATTTPSKPPE